jgi:uridylate kinase, putative
MNKTVISLGGSIFSSDFSYLKNFIDIMKEKETYAIVVGGGKIARERITLLREMGASEYHLDKMGIQATRLNALTVSLALGNAMDIPISIDKALETLEIYGKVVMGGTEPGHTTDAVSLLLAEAYGSKKVVNITDVDYIYDKNPKLEGAKKFTELTYEEVLNMLNEKSRGAGENFPMDILSINIARRSKIEIDIVSFKDKENLKSAIEGKKFLGTIIHS